MSKKRKNKPRAPAAKSQRRISNSGYSSGGASVTNPILQAYDPLRLSAKADIDANLFTLRNRSADQAINTPVGAAAIQMSALHTIGAGLKVFPRVRYQDIGMAKDEVLAWNRKARNMEQKSTKRI